MLNLTNQIVTSLAKEFGFDLVGFAKAEPLNKEIQKLELWLDKGYQATMSYMEKNVHKRKDVKEILPEAKSVISLAVNYYTDHQHSHENTKGKTCLPAGKVSRYAWGKDYHLIIWEMLADFEVKLLELEPELKTLSYIDTGPVMDKVWAVKSGIGWLGKHTNVINKEIGSWIFLANIITNYEFEYSEIITDHCGSCTACIDACPTDAIVEEYVVDSNKCISFLTIENKDEINPEFKGKFDNWIFGCDVCQDVCPWNIKFSEQTAIKDFHPVEGRTEIGIDEIVELDEDEFKEKFSVSPIKRAKLKGLKRNAEFIQQ
ncbi:MAG TPA: tRNA epoxyqueuosine(34) reductase QueG [Ignavibacteriaceae bacterium]|nr:tRNA epoxyqueuosine(34) reductase QueG [Ignavibacteriaceae bacterium]